MFKSILFCIYIIFLIQLSDAQVISDTIFFESGSSKISSEGQEKLQQIPFNHIKLNGFTDNNGSVLHNNKLSQARVECIQNFLITIGHNEDSIQTKYWGESKDSFFDQINLPEHKRRAVILTYKQQLKQEFYKFPLPEPESFSFKNSDGINIKLNNGVDVNIPPNAFQTGPNESIEFSITSYTSKSDFILANLQAKSDEQLLESAGMFYLNATSNGNDIELRPNKSLTVNVPNKEKKEGFELFYGQEMPGHTHQNALNWRLSTRRDQSHSQIVKNITLSVEGSNKVYTSQEFKRFRRFEYRDRFFRTKWFNVKGHGIEKAITILTESAKFDVNLTVEKGKLVGLNIDTIAGQVNPRCERKLKSLFKRAKWKKIKKDHELTVHIDYEHNRVNDDIPQIVDLNTVNIDSISLNTIALNVMKMGWINCDRFQNSLNKKPLYVQSEAGHAVKLVFKNINSIINGTYVGKGKYYFGKIPVNKSYEILSFKEEGNQVKIAQTNNKEKDLPLTYSMVSREKFMELLKEY